MSELIRNLVLMYRDPMFLLFPCGMWVVGVVSFLVFAPPFTWLSWRDPTWARPYRIQARRADLRRLILPSIKYAFLNMTVMFLLVALSWPLVRYAGVHSGPLPPWYVIVGQVIVFIFVDDFVYYFMHRVLHTRWLFNRVHSVHHSLKTPWSITALYMHPVEFILTGISVLAGPLLIGPHVAAIWAWIAVRQWVGVDGHCGYAFPLNPMRLLPGYLGPVFHDFHHSSVRGNYSGALGYLDGLLGTFSNGYRAWRPPFPKHVDGAGPALSASSSSPES